MDTQRCSHCGKEVLAQSFTLHEAHCKRNYESCECGQFVKLSDKQAHWSEKHAPKTCAHCRFEAPAYLLPLQECTNKPRVCQFCHAEISLDDFKEHLYVCSSRTQHCETCQKFIPNRDFEHHSSICIGASSEQAAIPSTANLFSNVDPELIQAQLLSEGKSPEEAEMLMAVRVAEELDRAYAEHIEHKLLMESIQAEHMEERRKVAVTNLGSRPMDEEGTPHDPSQDERVSGRRSEEDALPPSTPSSTLEKPEEGSSHETLSQEDRELNEVIFKSLYEK